MLNQSNLYHLRRYKFSFWEMCIIFKMYDERLKLQMDWILMEEQTSLRFY